MMPMSSSSTSPAASPAGASTQVAPGTALPSVAADAQGAHDALAALRARGEEIHAWARWLGADAATLAAAESLDRLELLCRVPAARLLSARLPANASGGDTFSPAFGDDLRLQLEVVGLDPDADPVAVVVQSGDVSASRALRSFLAALRRVVEREGEGIPVEARLTVGKAQAQTLARAALAVPEGSPATPSVLYTARALAQLLTLRSLPYLEHAGVFAADTRGEHPATMLVCDAAGLLAGPLLRVVGARVMLPPSQTQAEARASRVQAFRARGMRRLLVDEDTWPGALQAITPLHLFVSAQMPGLEDIAARLGALASALTAAYLAFSVRGSFEDGLLLTVGTYPAPRCLLDEAALEAIVHQVAREPAQRDGAARLLEWAYRHGFPDKLAIVRECLARELPPGKQCAASDVVQAMGMAYPAARANFALYLRGKTSDYFALRESALAAVTDYAAALRRTVGELAGEIVETLFRTVGLLLGVVVAALLQPHSSATVVQVATLLYALYLLFVLAFAMRSRADRFTLEHDALDARLGAMRELTAAERADLARPARAADALYTRYLRRALAVYAALLLAALVVAAHPLW